MDQRELDVWHMQRALELAVRGQGLVEPNPMVGCVVVQGAEVIGEGWHRRYGGPHAEIDALNRVELALNDSLTELLFAVRAALHENNLTPSQRAKLEDAYRSGRQVVSALDRVASELENGGS